MKRLKIDNEESVFAGLINDALAVRLNAYAPYSDFLVGAAILTLDGETFVGCNVENASFSLTICAERVAAGAAVANAKRDWAVVAIASRGGVTPCGACRQFLAEFGHDLILLCVDAESREVTRHQLSGLLPHSFSKDSLDS